MGWTWESVVSALGDDAQVVPGGVIKHHFDAETGTQRNVLVAALINGVVSVTDEGLAILGECVTPGVKREGVVGAVPAPRKRRTKAELAAAQAQLDAAQAELAATQVEEEPEEPEEPEEENLELDLSVDDLDLSGGV